MHRHLAPLNASVITPHVLSTVWSLTPASESAAFFICLVLMLSLLNNRLGFAELEAPDCRAANMTFGTNDCLISTVGVSRVLVRGRRDSCRYSPH
jgi:hypothetical protein